MSPEEAVSMVVQMFRDEKHSSESDLLARLCESGIDDELANRLMVLVPLAFSRAYFESVPMIKEYAEEYIIYDRGTGVETSHDLAADPYFLAAANAATNTQDKHLIQLIASRSAEFDAINNVLTSLPEGAIPKRIGTSTPYIGYGQPQPRPWWKFWGGNNS